MLSQNNVTNYNITTGPGVQITITQKSPHHSTTGLATLKFVVELDLYIKNL